MPGEISRAPMYVQVTDVLADEITTGKLAPGALLPSEADLERRFEISRTTVRAAIAALRSMGLIIVQQGKGSIVRARTEPTATLDRTITQTGRTYTQPHLAEADPPAVSRCTLTGRPAELLNLPDEDALSIDRTLYDETTGTRIGHRLFIPLATTVEAGALHDNPTADLATIYSQLRAVGHTLTFTEEVTSRMPLPDDRAALALADAEPLLVTYRTTHGTNNRPLICEELRTPASRTRLTYTITPTKSATIRSRAK